MISYDTKIKAMPYEKWIEFAVDNYEMVKQCYDEVLFEANVIDRETDEEIFVSHTLGEVMELCKNTSMEKSVRNSIMKAVYTGNGLDKNIQKVMKEFYVL